MKLDRTKRYTIEDCHRLHELAYAYKEGNVGAGLEILESFSEFLDRYVLLIHNGRFDLDRASIRSFIKLYVENQVKRSSITSYKHNGGAGLAAAQETVNIITPFFSNLTKEDLKQELSSILLVMAKRYKDTKPSFQNYVNKNFHFYVFRYFDKMTRDPLSRSTVQDIFTVDADFEINLEDIVRDESYERLIEDLEEEISLDQSIEKSNTTFIGQLDCTKSSGHSRYDDSFLDINWANGITCSEVFKVLNNFERRILILWYVEKRTDTEIADMFGVCRSTINGKRAKAKAKLEKEINRLNLSIK